MVPDDFHDFFVASAGVAGALIGLLFVAVSVTQDRLAERADLEIHRVRAAGALTAFSNALLVSLFALIPDGGIAPLAIAVGGVGTAFIAATVLSLLRLRRPRWSDLRDLTFLVGLAVVFVVQIVIGARWQDPPAVSAVRTLAVLVAICFVVGVSRAWELIGGPSMGLTRELTARVAGERAKRDPRPADDGS